MVLHPWLCRAKYGLATAQRIIEVFGGPIMMGYDIGCTFRGTVDWSPLVGPQVRESKFDVCVGAFHGPAHNWACQLDNHPYNIPGTGLTDFENCETLFSSSNCLAGLTCLASPFHRHQRIDLHFKGWDDDQDLNLGYLLRTKYVAAIKALDFSENALAKLCPEASVANLEHFYAAEKLYHRTSKDKLPKDTFAINYIDLLEKPDAKQAEYDHSHSNIFHASNSESSCDLRRATLLTSCLESRRRVTLNQLDTLQMEVAKLKDMHGIIERWTRQSDDWKKAEQLRNLRSFHTAVVELKRLVMLRLLELAKVGLPGTGYKARQHILKSFGSRSAAIKTSLVKYNKIVVQMFGPVAKKLSWDMISKALVLTNLKLLQDLRHKVLKQDWAKPEARHAVEHWHHMEHTVEELEHLNVEVRRVHTSIADEARDIPMLVSRFKYDQPGLAWLLDLLADLPGYMGSRTAGVRLGCELVNGVFPPSCHTPDANLLADPTQIGDPNNMSTPSSAEHTEHSLPTPQIVKPIVKLSSETYAAQGTDDSSSHEDLGHNDETSDEFVHWQSALDIAEDEGRVGS
ncbi:hypothetical protein FS749_005625 [Ceratobasidium sp. UAMH 11750]|nr:hypothetical protein FS749_005625 [Ceratobasidium sp. UAMH 11750]